MVNPERLHNAFAALDILARANSAAFEHGVNVSGEIAQDAALSGERYAVKRNRRTGDHDLIVDGKVHSEHATTTQALSQATALGLTKPFGSRNDAAPFGYTEIWTEDGLDQEVTHQGNYKQIIAREKKDLEKMGCRVRLKHFDASGKPMARLDSTRSDADRPQDLSDEALRLRISTLEADLRDAGRTARGPNMTNLNRQLDALVAELRKRRSRSDADETARKKVFHFTYKDPSGDNRTYSCEAYTQELAEQNLRRYRWVSGPITSVRTGGKE